MSKKFRVDYYAVVTVHAVREIEADSLEAAEAQIERERNTADEARLLQRLDFTRIEPITSQALSGVDVLATEPPKHRPVKSKECACGNIWPCTRMTGPGR